jgi:hypothetical protein
VDFEYLKSRGIDIRNHIVIARYGAIFRGNIVSWFYLSPYIPSLFVKFYSNFPIQVHSAEEAGAIGVILFSDPKDFAPEGRESVYPKTNRLPGMAAQSGSILLGYGDPLTPLYPALGTQTYAIVMLSIVCFYNMCLFKRWCL